jgi:hypothetical protein
VAWHRFAIYRSKTEALRRCGEDYTDTQSMPKHRYIVGETKTTTPTVRRIAVSLPLAMP